VVQLRCEKPAAGGDGISHLPDGRIVFIRGALPGELVEAQVVRQTKDYAKAIVVSVLDPSPDRCHPVCKHADEGCGGCSLQHATQQLQTELKRSIVIEALERIGKVQNAASIVTSGSQLPAGGHRNSVRFLCNDLQAAFRSVESNEPIHVYSCGVADTTIEFAMLNSTFGDAREITLRVGKRTGEMLAIVDPSTKGVALAKHDQVKTLQTVSIDVLREVEQPYYSEIVSEQMFRISAGSFFQTRTDGAEMLVELVNSALRSFGNADVLVDLYGGVGLFAATNASMYPRILSVEREGSSSLDAKFNLSRFSHAEAIAADVDEFDLRAAAADQSMVVIADPARAGLGRAGVSTIITAKPKGVVLISCDAAAFGRDAGLLASAGYRLQRSTVVDMFPHTAHVEVVSCFEPI
jgi:23S rRNA (uracil1939-C5)-methyltransferase